MNQRGVVVHQLARSIAAFGITLMLCGAASAFEGEMSLEKMRSMHYSGSVPELGNLSPATQIDRIAPKDSNFYTSAYRNSKGCVTFFYPMSKDMHDLAFSWRGSACNGKPVSGQGALQVQYKLDTTNNGTVTYVTIFEGSFSGGFPSGQGKKTNLLFDAQGKMKEDTREFIGQFEYGVLDGVGTRIWYGAASAQPNLKVVSGNFKKGETTEGKSVISILHPYPGAEAISQQVLYSDKGDEKYYTYQQYMNKAEVSGKIWFPGSDESWDTSIISLADEYRFKDATLMRLRGGQLQAMATCEEWQPAVSGWRCEGEKNEKYLMAHNQSSRYPEGVASKSPFILDIGSLNGTNPFRFFADGTAAETGFVVGLLNWRKEKDEPADSTCNAAMTVCERKELNKTGSADTGFKWRLIRTSMQWKNDKWFHQNGSTAYADANGNVDWVDSRCSQFSGSDSSKCISGEVFFRNGGKWTGGYILMYSGAYPNLGGYGRLTFASGRWAEGTKGEKGEAGTASYGDEWISLSRCGDEDGGRLGCELDGQTVVFDAR